MSKRVFKMAPKNLRDRLTRYSKKNDGSFFAPRAKDNPYPGYWCVDGVSMDFPTIVQWSVDHHLISGDDRGALLGKPAVVEEPRAVIPPVQSALPESVQEAFCLLEEHAKLLRVTIDKLPDPVRATKRVMQVIFA